MAQSKIGFVNSDRVLRESAPAVAAQKKLEKEFEKRDQELQKLTKQLQGMQENLERNAVTMAEADRKAKEREFAELTREFQRRQREFREDLNQRRNEELAGVLERANRTIREIADSEKYDAILQDAIYISPRVDLTDKVIKTLNSK
ncbi:OmpH family outer membrane protein [Niveibacterium sp. 24ML]|nr:OmpH family outer membrane protein [Niveibacterium sp. 24ML]MCX9156564.1 OmpH family outer membrane protein [Niveibacterium sp. 24ML]